MDPFDLLSIPPQFLISIPDVEKRYREVSRALHPDKYLGRPASERRMALSRAIEVNEAWRILRDPIKRAEALFRRAGFQVGDRAEPAADPELLMEMMELREALFEARASKNAGAIGAIIASAKDREQTIINSLAAGLDSPNSAELAALVPSLGELRYVRRLLDEASAAEDELS